MTSLIFYGGKKAYFKIVGYTSRAIESAEFYQSLGVVELSMTVFKKIINVK